MKQLLLLMGMLISLIAFSFPAKAQNDPIVALEHEGTTTYFTGLTCLEDAIAKAVDNDVLYLSEGDFGTTVGSHITIKQRLGLVGSGLGTNIRTSLKYTVADNRNYSFAIPMLRNLSINRVCFEPYDYQYDVQELRNVIIEKCKINDLFLEYVEDAEIKSCYLVFYAPYECIAKAYNTKIATYYGSSNCKDRVENCHIRYESNYNPYRPGYSYASIFEGAIIDETGYGGILENCLVPSRYNTKFYKNCYTYNGDTIFDNNLETNIDLKGLGYVDLDGDQIGIYGGKGKHYSEIPSVPVIDSANSKVEFDSEKGQLTIKASVIMD